MRSIVALALRTGIPVSTWVDEDPAVITTALELIAEQDEE
jgi:hypothetical protein